MFLIKNNQTDEVKLFAFNIVLNITVIIKSKVQSLLKYPNNKLLTTRNR